MDEVWVLHHGDIGTATRQMETAAVLATLVDPAQTALRVERAVEVRSDTPRVVYLLNPDCFVNGTPARTSMVRTELEEGTLEPDHPARDAQAGLENMRALRHWMRCGPHHRLEHEAAGQRTRYTLGSADVMGNVETISTHSLAKVAALGRLGMTLYNVLGTLESPQFIVHRHSVGMLDESGVPVSYDAAQLIMGEIQDTLKLDHPFMLAYRACLNYERLQRHVNEQMQLLLLTPDMIRKGAAYDPAGLHSYIAPDAPGYVWDKVERDFFG